MESKKLSKEFWNERWMTQDTGWDIGYPSPAIVEFVKTITGKDVRILIPGCGNAYEAEYLHKNGFVNVFVVDYASEALRQFHERVPSFPKTHLITSDFFEVNTQPFDFVLEQTFFCALDPLLRKNYVEKMYSLLKPGGVLAGLLFDEDRGTEGPPFGGNKAEYTQLFHEKFEIRQMKACENSIAHRAGREVWIEMVKMEERIQK